jgi:addiction module HigA family antidote
MPKRIKPVHPGEILYEEFMKPMSITQYRLAKDINVQPTRINKIIKGERSISVDTATRLGIYFKMGAKFWIGLQTDYDLAISEDKLEKKLSKEIQPYAA